MYHLYGGIPHVLDLVRIVRIKCGRETQAIYRAALTVQVNLI